MKKSLVLLGALTLAGCGMSEGEQTRIAQVACSVLSATSEEDSLDRIRIINDARQEVGAEIYSGSGTDVDRYLRFGVCIDFILDNDIAVTKADARKLALETMIDLSDDRNGTFLNFDVLADNGSYLFSVRKNIDGKSELSYLDAETMLPVTNMRITGVIHDHDSNKAFYDWDKGTISASVVNGVLEGEYAVRYENGTLSTTSNYINGKADGLMQSWHPNGVLARETEFARGEYQRRSRWGEDGSLMEEVLWKDGKMQKWQKWNYLGKLFVSLNFKDGKREGIGIYFGEKQCFRNDEEVDMSECEQ